MHTLTSETNYIYNIWKNIEDMYTTYKMYWDETIFKDAYNSHPTKQTYTNNSNTKG
jgi:hypothetical protein